MLTFKQLRCRWQFETSTNASFLDAPSVCVSVLAHVRSLSWETVLHAAVKVVAEEEEASAPHFLGVRMPLLEEFVASVSQLVETATHTPDAGASNEESSAGDEGSSGPRRRGQSLRRKSGSHLLGRSPAELMPSWLQPLQSLSR